MTYSTRAGAFARGRSVGMSTDQQSLAAAVGRDVPAAEPVERTTWRRWYMACLLTVLYIYAQIDSGSITLLVGPIKQDIGASDTQMGLLLGLSFAAPFALLGLPAG